MKSRFKGRVAELKFEEAATKLGWITSKPTTDACYDYIADDGQALKKVQVKWRNCLSSRKVAYQIDFRRSWGRRSVPHYNSSEIDAIVVYLASEDALLWLEPSIWAGVSMIQVRRSPARNGQKKGVHLISELIWPKIRTL
jgi:hypothetical protein